MLRVLRLWMDHGVRIFRVDNPHTKPVAFWEWLLGEVRKTDPDVIFLSEAFTRPAMMHGLGAVGFHQSYTYFTWRNGKRELEDYLAELSQRVRPPDAAELLREHPRHPARLPAVRRPGGVQDPGGAGGDRSARPGASTPASSCSSTSRSGRAARSTSTPRSTRSGPATGRPRRPRAARSRRTSPGSTRSAARHPALQLLRNLTVHRSDDDAILVFSKHAVGADGHSDIVIVVVNLDSARAPARPWSTWTCRRSAWTGTTRSWSTTSSPAQTWHWGRAQLRAPRPGPRARPHPHDQEAPLTASESTDSTGTAATAASRDWWTTRTGSSARSSTRCWSGRSRTPTATAPATSQGLTEKLDYLQWLGVDCLWLPPFFPSPLRDGGYDVADYTDVLPEFGTIDDFARVPRRRARARHPGDHRLRHEPHLRPAPVVPGVAAATPTGPYGDFYVWSDTDELYPDARIIFVDTEPSNWTWDPVRQQYYWHRFFSHQPDLNFENPAVHDAMIEALTFWLDLGIDGFRLDAVPYLYEDEGTNCENLPETHEFLRKVRKLRRRRTTPTGCCSPRRTSGRPTSSTTSATARRGTGRRRVPHGVPLPGDAAHLHGAYAASRATRSRRSWRRPRRSPTTASGASSCATTTS